jgi:hypothetical protein
MEGNLSIKKRFQDGKRAFIYDADQWRVFSSICDHFLVFSFPFLHRNNSTHLLYEMLSGKFVSNYFHSEAGRGASLSKN